MTSQKTSITISNFNRIEKDPIFHSDFRCPR